MHILIDTLKLFKLTHKQQYGTSSVELRAQYISVLIALAQRAKVH